MINKGLWWLYAGLIIALGMARGLYKIIIDSGGFWSQYGPVLAALLIGGSLTLVLLEKPLFRRSYWRLIFGLLLTCMVVGGALLVYLSFTYGKVIGALLLMLAGVWFLLLPAVYRLFRFVYRSIELFENAEARAKQSKFEE